MNSLASTISVDSRVVNTMDLQQILTDANERRQLTSEQGIKHDTKLYDSLSSVTVKKANGWIYNFAVSSYRILSDTTLELTGSTGEVLSYPSDGTGWKLATDDDSNLRVEDAPPPSPSDEGSRRRAEAAELLFPSSSRRLSSKSSLYKKSIASPCKTYIESEDSWCSGSKWDQFCAAGCDGPTKYMSNGCLSECTEPAIIAGERAKRVVTRCSPVRNCFLYMAFIHYTALN